MKCCEYIKTNKGYATSCGIVISHIGRKWIYCPHCGKYIYAKAESEPQESEDKE